MSNLEGVLVDSPHITANELVMAKGAAEKLHEHYPGHLWGVSVEGSRLIIKNMALAGDWGYALFIPQIYSASSLDKDVIKAGGEILERYHQARGQVDYASLIALPTDFAGRHQADM